MFQKFVLCVVIFLLGLTVLPGVFAWENEPGTEKTMLVQEFIAQASFADLRWLVVPREWRKNLALKSETQDKFGAVAEPVEIRELPSPVFAYSKIVLPLSEEHGMDWKLVAAVMAVESNYNPKAVSNKGAVGLMQLMPTTAAIYKVSYQELFNPRKNIEAGVKHLKKLHKRYDGDLPLVVAAYNSGEGAVDRFRGIPPYRHTKAFVRKVMARYKSHLNKELRAISAIQAQPTAPVSIPSSAVGYK